jgi:16S rRNA (uracil1498-N3)-methyltransferase
VTVPTALRTSAAHVFVQSLEQPVLADGDLHHLRRVLRVRDSDVISISDGAGRWRTGRLAGDVFEADGAIVAAAPTPAITIATAIPKGDRVEWMVQKLTEVGVARIVLIDCSRSVVRWSGDRAAKQLERLHRISREAAMQSRQVRLPDICGPVPFGSIVDGNDAGVVIADPDGGPPGAAPWHTVVIGPEGGLTTEEIGCGAPAVSLGEHVLRIETAALIAAVLAARTVPGPLREEVDGV